MALGLVLAGAGSASAQGLFGLASGPSAFAPVQHTEPVGAPFRLLPANPKANAERNAAQQASAHSAGITLEEHAEPRFVQVTLPLQRSGRAVMAAAPPQAGSSAEEAAPAEAPQSIPLPPRIAALSNPVTMTDAAPMRPPGLRVSEYPVAGMPGVFADEDAEFQCLPQGLKQVLSDTAQRFGHVAILNARRSRGTGARESYHYQCRAVDFRVRGVPVRTVYAFLKAHPNVGGRRIYPMGFFHVDNGPARTW